MPRQVDAKVEFDAGELFRRVGFIMTNMQADSRAVVRVYNKQAVAEQWTKRRRASGEDGAPELPSAPVPTKSRFG